MIVLVMLQRGIFRDLDVEKLRYFFGVTADPLYLSRRFPLYRRLHLLRLLFSLRYARGCVEWLRYRADLYDGRQG